MQQVWKTFAFAANQDIRIGGLAGYGKVVPWQGKGNAGVVACRSVRGVTGMNRAGLLILAADVILLVHVLFVLFILVGLLFIYVGRWRSWSWVRNPWFRITHLSAIAGVVIQSWFGINCPLTTLEMALRWRTGDAAYTGSFLAHWLETILYYQAPAWVFVLVYSIFGVLVLVSWFVVRPRGFRKNAV